MPPGRNIPGYHYDETTGKYYKTLPNHLAPSGSQHSRQAVSKKESLAITQREQTKAEARRRRDRVRKTAFARHVQLSLLGRLGRTSPSVKGDTLESLLQHVAPIEIGHGHYHGGFLIDPCTNLLFLASADTSLIIGSNSMEARRFTSSAQAGILSSTQVDSLSTYSSVQHMVLVGTSHFVHTLPDWQTIHISSLRYPRESTTKVFHSSPLSQEFRTHNSDFSVHAIVSTPRARKFAAATTLGLFIGEIDTTFNVDFQPARPKRSDEITHEQMAVSFKEDESTIMCGERSGKIWFYDTLPNTYTLRLHHSDAISHLQSFSSGNLLLVNGLRTLDIYDLRHTPAPSTTKSHSRKKHKHNHNNNATNPSRTSHTSPTSPTSNTPSSTTSLPSHPDPSPKPYLSIPIAPPLHSDRYGCGFSFHPQLNLVARASSNSTYGYHLTLYNLRTGRPIDCPLTRKKFPDVVSCVEITTGPRDGSLSVIVGCDDGKVEEWTVA